MRKIKSKSYQYIENLSENENSLKQKARDNSEKLGLEGISLSKAEAQIIQFFLVGLNPKKVVEIGTLTGLSALYILESLGADGQLWTLEKSAEHVRFSSEVLSDSRCKILEGDARIKLQEIQAAGPFDAVFIDGNKAAYLDYFNWALVNTRVGGMIFADNIFLAGAIWGDQTTQKFNEKQIGAVNEMNQQAFKNKNLHSMIIPTEEGLLICKKLF